VSKNITRIIKKERLLLFDILRTLAVVLIVISHIGAGVASLYRFIGLPNQFLTYYFNSGALGVYLLVFVSGAVLAYQYNDQNNPIRYFSFLVKRIERLYPAYWLVLFLCVFAAPGLILTKWHFALQLFGILPFIVYFAWWIGLFVCLYICFPFILKATNKKPFMTIIVAFIISIMARLTVARLNGHYFMDFTSPLLYFDRVFFPCLLFEFTLGVLFVNKSFLTKFKHKSAKLSYVSDLSYYIFLTHVPYYYYINAKVPHSFWKPHIFVSYLVLVVGTSVILKVLDGKVQISIKALHARSVSKPLPG
jgi:peptidoglycan/LPS O-acetylase OafA/YrhL